MDKEELDYNIRICAFELHVDKKYVRPIPKNELIVGKEYVGNCRNSSKAVWKGDHFEYQRYKFGYCYTDKINHYEDDDGYDVFVPVEIVYEAEK